MQLSEHFSLDEFTFSETALRKNIDNTPPSHILPILGNTATCMEGIRTLLGHPIHINSAYRCPTLNAAVGSKPTSQHTSGNAVDFTCKEFGTPRDIVLAIKASNIKYDQLIYEFNSWVHISFSNIGQNRMAVLTIDSTGTRSFA